MKRVKLLSLFSGIGAFETAFRNLGVPYDLVGFSEIDKYAVKSYCALFDEVEEHNLGDITKVDETTIGEADFICYGFPCQDISIAGKLNGFEDAEGNRTRSGLFFDALRIIEAVQPRVAIAENVKNLTSKRFKAEFETVLKGLDEAGYNNYWKVLNAKDYGIPQNRERVFIVSIRKDVDDGKYEFPLGWELDKCLGDMLDEVVDEKYYVESPKAHALVEKLIEDGTLSKDGQQSE